MRQQLQARWHDLQASLWFLPAVLTLVGAVLAVALVQLDHAIWPDGASGRVPLVFGGGTQGARGVLAAIAGSLITVTATVFSITVVALQLASSQFTPRLLRNFTADRSVQAVLGIFIATFTYALLVLRTIRDGTDNEDPFIPNLSVTVGIVLALTSIGMLIFFIHHVTRSIQVAVILDRTTRETLSLVDERYPDDVGAAGAFAESSAPLPAGPSGTIRSPDSGYLQEIDSEALFAVVDTDGGGITLRVEQVIGDFVLPGATLVTVWPASAVDEELEGRVNAAFVLGLERTLRANVELGIQQIAEIALKALSPGINDPTTARICIDRLCEVIVRLANREPPRSVRTGDGGGLLVLPTPSFGRLLDTAFAQIRHYGAGDAIVIGHLATKLEEVARLAPPRSRDALAAQARLALASARDRLTVPDDLHRVEQAAAWAMVEARAEGVDTVG